MLRSIDGKSLLIGGLLVLVVVCAMGGVPMISPEFNGRFELVANDLNEWVIDTATGQVWGYHPDPQAFYAPKLEGYAPESDPNGPQP